MTKAFKRLNYIFLHDEDEKSPVSEYVLFYGIHVGALMVAGFYFIKLITL